MMHNTAGGAYFENQVATASPERLQFQLIDSALRAARRAVELYERDQAIAAGSELAHAEAIVAEVIGAMRRELEPTLVDRARQVYAFILRSLLATHETGQTQPLRDAIRVLAVEHETWRMASERASQPPQHAPAPHIHFHAQIGSEGLTFEA